MNIVLIMAKHGSLGLPGKNIWKVKGKPLLAWTIEEAKQSKLTDRIFVSTNGDEVANVAKQSGAEVIKREDELAKNEKFLDAVDQAIQMIEKQYGKPALIAIPQCVVPFRDLDIYDRMFKFLAEHKDYDSAVTVRQVGFIPEALMKIENDQLKPYYPSSQQTVSPSRQDSAGFEIDHAVECFRYQSWLNREKGIKPWNYLGQKVKPFLQTTHNHNCFVDVHTLDDARWLEFIVEHLGFQGMKREGKL